MGEPSRKRVTYTQLDHLWEFLMKHKSLAMGHNKTAQAREFSRRMWEEVALNLNAHGDGAVKNWKGWCKYWNDFKSKLKKSAAAAKLSQHRTGGGPSCTKTMTDLEIKYLQILGDDFGTGLPGIRVDPFEELMEPDNDITTNKQSESQPGSSQDVTPPPISPKQPTFRRSPRKTPPHFEPPAAATLRRSPRRPRNLKPTFSPYTLVPTPLPYPHEAIPSPCPPAPTPSPRPPAPTPSPHPPAPTPSPHPPAPTPSPHPPAPTPSPHPPAPTAERRRRTRQEPLMTSEMARRTLIVQSQRLTTIEEEKLEVMKNILQEMREMKEMIRAKFRDPPADVE